MKNYIVSYTSLFDNCTEIFFIKAESFKEATLEMEVAKLPKTIKEVMDWTLTDDTKGKTFSTWEEAALNYRNSTAKYMPEELEGIKEHYFNGDAVVEIVEFKGTEFLE